MAVDCSGHMVAARQLTVAGYQHFLRFSDCSRRVEILWAGIGTVHDRVTSIQPERILQIIEPVIGRFITGINKPSIGNQ